MKRFITAALWISLPGLAQVPPPAADAIDRVHLAARERNMVALRQSMMPQFKWTFGPGDETADEAIRQWGKDPGALRQLAIVTGGKCELMDPATVQCPAGAGRGFRAGFHLVDGHWKLDSFLAGD